MMLLRIQNPLTFSPLNKILVISMALFAVALGSEARAQQDRLPHAIIAAADALGMIRGSGRRLDSLNTIQFSGSSVQPPLHDEGDRSTFNATDVTVGISYHVPAMRLDMTERSTSASRRTIRVVRDDEAWDEIEPGIGRVSVSESARDRRRQIWLTPHGAIRAAVDAELESPGSVRIEELENRTTLSLTVDDTPMVVALGADHRPERIEINHDHPILGETTHIAEFSGYSDWTLLDVYFPSRIVHKLGDLVISDLEISSFYPNPYVVFPDPIQASEAGG